MGRSYKEIFELGLCQEVSKKAFINTVEQTSLVRAKREQETNLTVSDALLVAFNWNKTPEGAGYWADIQQEAREREDQHYNHLVKGILSDE